MFSPLHPCFCLFASKDVCWPRVDGSCFCIVRFLGPRCQFWLAALISLTILLAIMLFVVTMMLLVVTLRWL